MFMYFLLVRSFVVYLGKWLEAGGSARTLLTHFLGVYSRPLLLRMLLRWCRWNYDRILPVM
jgi:hypothetical protein